MSAQAPDRKLHPVVWVLAGILCLCTLTALWVTAARVRVAKLAARYGTREEPEPGTTQLRLKRGQTAPAQHLTLAYVADGLEVRNAQGRALVRYPNPKPGQRLGWQELRLTLRDAPKDELRVDVDFVPGAASTGAGIYMDLRAGLRVEFSKGRSVTLTDWDPVKLEGKVKIEAGDRNEERPLSSSPTLYGLSCTLRQESGGQLLLEDLN
jgi:hypothetical protein